MKRGQVSIFILIGLLILLFVVFFVLYGQVQETPQRIQEETTDVVAQQLVLSCFDPIAEEAIFISAFQGGYIELTDRKDDPERKQQYYYYYQDISPNLTTVYTLLELYILNNTISCIEESAQEQNIDLTIDADHAFVLFVSEDQTEIDLHLPLTLTIGTVQSTLSDFSTTVSVPFEKMYGITREIVNSIEASDPLVCMTCLHDITTAHFILLSVNDYEEIGDYYVLYDPTYELYEMPFTFSFAVKMKETLDVSLYLEEPEHEQLHLELPTYRASVGKPFVLNVNNEDFLQEVIQRFIEDPTYSLLFFDFTPLFDIDQTLGVIQFTPTEQQKGTHSVLLKIEDSYGNVEYVTLQLVIQ